MVLEPHGGGEMFGDLARMVIACLPVEEYGVATLEDDVGLELVHTQVRGLSVDGGRPAAPGTHSGQDRTDPCRHTTHDQDHHGSGEDTIRYP